MELSDFEKCILLIVYGQRSISLGELEDIFNKDLVMQTVHCLEELGLIRWTYSSVMHFFMITPKGFNLCVQNGLFKNKPLEDEMLLLEGIRIPISDISRVYSNDFIRCKEMDGLREIFIDAKNLAYLHSRGVFTLGDLQETTISELLEFDRGENTKGQLGRVGILKLIVILKFYSKSFADGNWSV